MKYHDMRCRVVILFLGLLILFSGCILHTTNDSSRPAPAIQQPLDLTCSPSSGELYRITIYPIEDLITPADSTLAGSVFLNISGTTSFPAGTQLDLYLTGKNREPSIFHTTLEVRNDTRQNYFTYSYDMKGEPTGDYHIALVDPACRSFSAFEGFTVRAKTTASISGEGTASSPEPSTWWIRMDRLERIQKGNPVHLFGTTNLPAGTAIDVMYSLEAHSCTPSPTPDPWGQRSFCGGSCKPGGSTYTVRVLEGVDGENRWNASFDTTDWCSEPYALSVWADTWPNVTRTYQYIGFHYEQSSSIFTAFLPG